MWDTVLPECREGEDTYAYSLDEILKMIELVPEPASTMIASAGFAGLRNGELRAFAVENYEGEAILVAKSTCRRSYHRTIEPTDPLSPEGM